MKKIDIHCHTTTRWLKDTVDGEADVEHILKRMDEYEIEKTVLLATYFPHKGSGISNYRLLRWIEKVDPRRARFVMFASLDFDRYPHMGLNEIEELHSERLIKGIKLYTCYQDIDVSPASQTFHDLMMLARKHELPVMLHTGYSYACKRKYGRDSVAKMYSAADLYTMAMGWPNVNFIFSHMSKPFFREIVDVCALDNVYTDMSGIIDSTYDEEDIPLCVEEIKAFLRKRGPEKLLFGTDFPVQTHDHSVRFIEDAMKGSSQKDKELVYYGNAARLLRLED